MFMRQSPLSPKPDVQPDDRREASMLKQKMRLFWLCLALGLLALILLVWFFGLTWWTLLIGVLVIGCPVVMAWILLGGFD
jgi:fatty acid desaturase